MSKRKILVRGPALSRSGYGEHCRAVLRSLRSDDRNEVYLLNVGWGSSGWLCEDTEERSWIDQTIIKTASEIQSGVRDFATSIQVQLPIEWQNLCERNIGVCAGVETTKPLQNGLTLVSLWIESWCRLFTQKIVLQKRSLI